MQQFQSFRPYRYVPPGYTGKVATRPAQTGDKSEWNWVEPYVENDWNRGGCRLSGQRSGRASWYSDHAHSTTNQISRQLRKSIVPTLSPAIFNRHISALEETAFAQALLKGR